MFHNLTAINGKRSQHGSALVIAIFVLVIMTLIGSALIRMQSSSGEAIVYEVMGTRAYAAAQTGIQWQLSQLFPLNSNSALCANPINEPDVSNTPSLENCWFNIVTCNSDVSHAGVQYYTVTSTGSCSIGGIDTSRTIAVEARSIN